MGCGFMRMGRWRDGLWGVMRRVFMYGECRDSGDSRDEKCTQIVTYEE